MWGVQERDGHCELVIDPRSNKPLKKKNDGGGGDDDNADDRHRCIHYFKTSIFSYMLPSQLF
jgi:hypothetical protein